MAGHYQISESMHGLCKQKLQSGHNKKHILDAATASRNTLGWENGTKNKNGE